MSAHSSASLYDGIPSLASQAEDFITRAFYGKTAAEARKFAYAMGLQSPLWLWTHQQLTKDAGAPKEMRKVVHLLHWMHRHGAEMARVAVLVPLAWKAMFKHEFEVQSSEVHVKECPVILAHHELAALNKRDNTKYQYRAVLYLVDALPRNLNASAQPMPVSEEKFISEAMGAATDAFVLCADAGWMAPQLQAKWYKTFVAKLQGEQPPISFDESVATEAAMHAAGACFPSLVGPAIPLCCSRHPNQRQLEYGHVRIEPCCKHLCLSPYLCHRQDHICTRSCHPGEGHVSCPYACGKTLPCGHKCLLKCGQPCNCFEVIEQPLTCSHEKLLGINKETLEPIYTVVQHVFKGVCSDAALPCAVEYETECARCLGPLTVRCFEAQEQGHTLEHKTMICGACKRRERQLRAKLLGELLTGAEAQKKKMKATLQQSLHYQRKAAAQGLFRPGTRVEIIDATKCVPPLFAEDDFPGIEFADLSAPNFFQEMDGAYGTFVSNHVDVMDRSEVRNLVCLPSGKHVLVTDGGLRMIQALTSNITSAAPLMLTFQGHGGNSGSSSGGESADAATTDGAEFAAAKTMLNGTFYLAQPVPCDEVDGAEVLTDKVVRVVSLDPLFPKNVMAECTLYTVTERSDESVDKGDHNGQSAAGSAADTASTPHALKRRRVEAGEADHATHDCVPQTILLSVPIAALEPMRAMVEGKYVFVIAPERQVRQPHDLVKLEAQLRHLPGVELPSAAHVTAAPIDPDTPYTLVTVINPPVNCEAARGPCAVLKFSGAQRVVRAKMSRAAAPRRGGRGTSPQHHPRFPRSTAHSSPAAVAQTLYAIVPFMFVVGDELAEAEGALDAAAQEVFQQRLHDELTALSEDLALRNEEEAFHAQQQMPPVTASMVGAERRALSVPVPLLTPSAIATARKSAMELPVGSPIATRLVRTKDKLAYKQEAVQLPLWVSIMKEKAQKDQDSDAHHVKYIRSLRR
ncbi:hypothetical protein ABB37_01458 [Leptomonas pyrrhocoris]|uniref:Uncharacterized protein n=1 Tax=Leptomonas pyrrhocoris TaxID=157538 RepID=A0A0N0DZ94_LEPPY|nr:hypothetical protein ABB37_01458 [Leptomonas pyrrhocoris]KPA85035.1 hypothetical protein ABB37_01458 [Leptomonas pyrrhocoris]|eukprot:XP_015663474.1 hypothetical protein ABB37_01458 [Leptomonas pyrrhocoris]